MPQPEYSMQGSIPDLFAERGFTEQLKLLVLSSQVEGQTIQRLLGGIYDVMVVDNLDELMSCIYQHDFSLVVIYPQTSGKSGVECVEQLKVNPLCCDIPVIAVLAAHARAEEFATIQAGAIDCLVMPIKPVILSAKIQNHMATAERIKQLEVASCTDGLTGLNNRTQLETVLTKEWFNARRGQYFISALMIDVDFFKNFNDCFGHLQGDECLKSIAELVHKTRLRSSDFAARFGGEEFVMILPFTDSDGAAKLAHRLIQRVRQRAIPNAQGDGSPVTISIGISTCTPHTMGVGSDKPWQLIELADIKLYEAKESGRDRFCC